MNGWPRPLGQRLPKLTKCLEPLALGELPTRIQRLSLMGRHISHNNLYVKRDDETSRLYGGNKIRKLEFLLADAKRKQAKILVTVGAYGSHHLLATALHGRSVGMRTVGVVFPQPMTDLVQQTLAATLSAGTRLIRSSSKYLVPVHLAATLLRAGFKNSTPTYYIAGGGSSALGALGYVNAGIELANQVAAGQLPEPEAVFLPFGTGGTVAGLALGLHLMKLKTRIVAVRVVDRLIANKIRLRALLRALAGLLAGLGEREIQLGRVADHIEIHSGYFGTGYGSPTPEAKRAIDRFKDLERISLEPTYTGKTAAAFLDYAKKTSGPLVFINTYASNNISAWTNAGLALSQAWLGAGN